VSLCVCVCVFSCVFSSMLTDTPHMSTKQHTNTQRWSVPIERRSGGASLPGVLAERDTVCTPVAEQQVEGTVLCVGQVLLCGEQEVRPQLVVVPEYAQTEEGDLVCGTRLQREHELKAERGAAALPERMIDRWRITQTHGAMCTYHSVQGTQQSDRTHGRETRECRLDHRIQMHTHQDEVSHLWCIQPGALQQ
jgi:hypothetical protein